MKKSVFTKFALTAGATLALVAGQSFAAPSAFTVNQAAIGGSFQGPALVTGTQFSGNASELLRFSAGDTVGTVNSGFLRFSSIFNQSTSSAVSLNASSFAGQYGMYALFDFTATYNAVLSGVFAPGQAGSQYDISALNFRFFADKLGDTTFVNANATTGTEANRSGAFGDDVLLAFGSLLSTANPDIAGFSTAGGAFENSLTSFAICTGANTAKIGGANVGGTAASGDACASNMGINYFAQPVPFYPLAFDAFNNTGNSLSSRVGNNLAVEQSVGAVSFQGNAVPEPSSIALVGIATLALSLSGRRRRKSE